jgi:A/G-specific adenine glycosylase
VDVEALLSLPGIGPYTAGAVASFSANADVVLWDTNVRRIALRYFFGGEFARSSPSDAQLHAVLDASFPKGQSRVWHNALMDFGSAVCVGRNPSCAVCPLRRSCVSAPKFLRGLAPKRPLVRPQARFEGSRRQARGAILGALAKAGKKGVSLELLQTLVRGHDAGAVVDALAKEGMIVRSGTIARLP